VCIGAVPGNQTLHLGITNAKFYCLSYTGKVEQDLNIFLFIQGLGFQPRRLQTEPLTSKTSLVNHLLKKAMLVYQFHKQFFASDRYASPVGPAPNRQP